MSGWRIDRLVDEDSIAIARERIFPALEPTRLHGVEGVDALSPLHFDAALQTVHLAMASWLLRDEAITLLVDTCIGQHKDRPLHPAWHRRRGDRLLRDLAAHGLAPNDVDLVLCTHLHADHVGWNTRLENGRWVPTFPKARYAMAAGELAWCKARHEAGDAADHGAYADSVLPVVERGQALFVAPGEAIAADARIEALPGHTPASWRALHHASSPAAIA